MYVMIPPSMSTHKDVQLDAKLCVAPLLLLLRGQRRAPDALGASGCPAGQVDGLRSECAVLGTLGALHVDGRRLDGHDQGSEHHGQGTEFASNRSVGLERGEPEGRRGGSEGDRGRPSSQ